MLYQELTEEQRKAAAKCKINVVTGAITTDANGDVYVIEYKDTCIYAYTLTSGEKKGEYRKKLLGQLSVGCRSNDDFYISNYSAENKEVLGELFKYAENMAYEHNFQRVLAKKCCDFNEQYKTSSFFKDNGFYRITNSAYERIYENSKLKYRYFDNDFMALIKQTALAQRIG